MIGLSPVGRWQGTLTTRTGVIVEHQVELVIEAMDPLAGEIRIGDGGTSQSLTEGSCSGSRVEFSYPSGDADSLEKVILALSRHENEAYLSGSWFASDGRHHVGAVRLTLQAGLSR
jgi:hypothetical protein